MTALKPARFEYRLLPWEPSVDTGAFQAILNDAGREGWEAVGLGQRGSSLPMPGTGAASKASLVVILKRELPASVE